MHALRPGTTATLIHDFRELFKVRVTGMVLVTGWAGFYLGSMQSGISTLQRGLIDTLLGIGLVSAGAGALNQALERSTDARMIRTADRPLPSGRISLAQGVLAGIAALADKEFLHKSLELNAAGMRFLTTSLREIGLQVVPSEANFLMVPLPSAEHAARLTGELLQQGIIIRPLASFGLPNCVRISTGTAEDNQRCVQAIQKLEVPLSCNR